MRNNPPICGIIAGVPGEPVLASWTHGQMCVMKRPDDIAGILRMSVGGGLKQSLVDDYCVFRGDRAKVIELLESALEALKHPTF